MSIDWSVVFAEGFADHLQEWVSRLGQEVWLLSDNGQVLWPNHRQRQAPSLAWREPLHANGHPIGYLAGTAAKPDVIRWLALLVEQRVQNILLERQLHQSQVRLIEEIKAHTELEEALKFMELKALQSQVNPHFLFNTLTTIAGLSIFESAMQTTELVQSLSRLLRYSLRSIGQTVTLSEELAYVDDYLAIQKARFGDRITVETEISPDVRSAQVPVLTLQPIVENAIIHGLESKMDGLLRLTAHADGERVVILVIDNGVGIEPARLAEIKELRAGMSGRSHTTGLGFANVHKRLQHFFGSSYGLQLESAPGKGTRVTITLPLVE
ncbi:MAG: sensor histidine kinase [Bacillota bacterium]|jgi:two-component system LytT family sensor kinase